MRYLPLLAVNVYVVFGMLVSFFGPLQYANYDKESVLVFITALLFVFSLAYFLGARTRVLRSTVWSKRRKDSFVEMVFRISLTVSIVFLSYEFLNGLLVKGLSFSLADVGSAYINSYDGHIRNSGSYSLNFLFLSISALPIFITQVWSVLFFDTFSRRTRMLVLYVFAIILIIYTLGGGKQKQLGDILIIVSVVYFIKCAYEGTINFSSLAKVVAFIGLGVYSLLYILSNRYQNIDVDLNVLNERLHPLISYQSNNAIENIFGEAGAFPLVMLSSYIGQGYYGLSLALEQPFTWTYFGGSSYSISVILNRVFGTDFLVEKSYPYLVGASTGWSEDKWHTVFAWLASDLTFPGTILFCGVVGFFFARTCKEAIYYRNPFSVLLLTLLSIGFFYIPANNQLMHSPGGLWTLGWILILYARFARRYNYVGEEAIS